MSEKSNGPDVSDEDILNVLREEGGDRYLSTKEIADELSIGKRQTGGRLNELEGKDRVERRRFGQSHAWRLGPNEPTNPVDPELGPVIQWSVWSKSYGKDVQRIGLGFFVLGGVLAFVSLTASLQNVALPPFTNTELLVIGYGFLAASGAVFVMAALFRLVGIAAPRIAERRIKKRSG